MKKLLAIAAIAAAAITPAHAAFVSTFMAEADGPNGERGVANGTLHYDSMRRLACSWALTLTLAGPTLSGISPYFDSGNGRTGRLSGSGC